MGVHYWLLLHFSGRKLLYWGWSWLFGLQLVHLSIEGLKFINRGLRGLRCLSEESRIVLCCNTERWLITKLGASSWLRETTHLFDNSGSWFNNIDSTLYLKWSVIAFDSNSAMNGNILNQVESMHPRSLESRSRYQLLVKIMVRNAS